MTAPVFTRRQAAGLAAAAAVTTAASAVSAKAAHPNLEKARTALMEAKGHLETAVGDGTGHRAKALEHATQAIDALQRAIASA